MIDALWNDLRFSMRLLAKSPGLTLVVVAVLGIGIGLNTANFNAVNSMLLRPLPYHQPERLVAVFESQPHTGPRWGRVATPTLFDLRRDNRTLAALGACARGGFNLGIADQPERIAAALVTANLFPLLGVHPALGRGFTGEEDRPGGPRAVLLSDELWRRRFDARKDAVGAAIDLDGERYTVVGVMPPRFEYPEWAKLWVPLALDPADRDRQQRWLEPVGRLRDGVTAEQASGDLAAIAARIEKENPASNAGWTASARELRDSLIPAQARAGMLLMLAAVGMVQVIVCANVANLLLARAQRRRKEIALRSALGAGRRRLVAQQLIETLLLALGGGALGVLLSLWFIRAMVAIVPVSIPFWIRFDLDYRVLLYGLGVALATGLLFGMAPALGAARDSYQQALKETPDSRSRNRLRSTLIVAEFALSLVLLASALLLVKSYERLNQANLGFERERLLTLRFTLAGADVRQPDQYFAALERVLAAVAEAPGVRSVGAVNYLPVSRDGYELGHFVPGGKDVPKGEELPATVYSATRGYFESLGVPLVRGRAFNREEIAQGAPLALVNETLAKKLWVGTDAVGRRLGWLHDGRQEQLTVVGVTGDIVQPYQIGGLDAWPAAQVFVPYKRLPGKTVSLAVRTGGDPLAAAPAVRERIRAALPGVPIYNLLSMRQVLTQVLWLPRYWSQLFNVFGVLAALLAAIGLFGVVAYSVHQRSREMGIRLAVGARRGELLTLVVAYGLRLAAYGLGIGLLLLVAASRLLATLLQGVSPLDPPILAGVGLALTAIAFLASVLPACRLLQLDPVAVLRTE
jgi:putative ABC transport system permease protein